MGKNHKRILLTGGFLVMLSLASTGVSFLNVVEGGWGSDLRGIPEEEIWELSITRYGFPFGWYAEIVLIVGGQIEEVTKEFRSEPFIIDTVIYLVAYSLVAGFIHASLRSKEPRQ